MSSGLNLRCKNCGQPATDADIVCFHCGQPLPGREEPSDPTVKVEEGWPQSISPRAAAAYIGIAAFVFLAFLLVTRNLGQRPLVQVGFATRPANGWQQVVNNGEDFLFYLPENWDSYDGLDPARADELALRLTKSDVYQLATQPLSSLTDDIEIMYLAQNGRPAEDDRFTFLIIGRSPSLNNLGYDEVLNVWRSDPNIEGPANFVEDFAKSRAEAIFVWPIKKSQSGVPDEALKCQQQFVRGEAESILLTICTPAERYVSRAPTIEKINNSFQRLDN